MLACLMVEPEKATSPESFFTGSDSPVRAAWSTCGRESQEKGKGKRALEEGGISRQGMWKTGKGDRASLPPASLPSAVVSTATAYCERSLQLSPGGCLVAASCRTRLESSWVQSKHTSPACCCHHQFEAGAECRKCSYRIPCPTCSGVSSDLASCPGSHRILKSASTMSPRRTMKMSPRATIFY